MTIETRPYHVTREQTRGINLVQGIVLHEVNEGAAMLDGRMQTPLAFTDIAHQAYHFSVDANGIRAYVPIADATFAIGNVDTMSPWTVAAANPGIDPDLYTVNVAVLIGTASLPSPCLPGCGREYPPTLLRNLQELLAYIAEEATLDLETPNIVWLHGTELCDLDVDPLLLPIEEIDPGQSDWLCDRLADLPVGQSETPMVVGADCAVYPMPVGGDNDWLIDALGGGRHTPTSTATGGNAFAAGTNNEASGQRATVGGGNSNTASAAYSTVGGGKTNIASGNYTTVGGGTGNTAGGMDATIGGGSRNIISSGVNESTICGGLENTITGGYAVSIGGGIGNTASGNYATVGGGSTNIADGLNSAILGGTTNDTNEYANAMIVGSNITASLANALHCNRLVITQIPVASAGLPSGAVWSDSGTLKIVP
jgi:hypothetical protein